MKNEPILISEAVIANTVFVVMMCFSIYLFFVLICSQRELRRQMKEEDKKPKAQRRYPGIVNRKLMSHDLANSVEEIERQKVLN